LNSLFPSFLCSVQKPSPKTDLTGYRFVLREDEAETDDGDENDEGETAKARP
jgi:hypothetical protein